MTLLFIVFLGVMAVAVGTTIVAIVRAKDGYEDGLGFHLPAPAATSTARNEPVSPSFLPIKTGGRSTASVPVLTATSELPSTLLEGRFSP
jgi:hypothetical protein